MSNIYSLKPCESPWGDYGDILLQGMATHNVQGLLELDRTGPFIPPISFPGLATIVVSDGLRRQLDSSGLTGIAYRPVIKRHIVHLEWEHWDRTAGEPQEYPLTGEPGDYVLGHEHSDEAARQMGQLWEVSLDEHIRSERTGSTAIDSAVYLLPSTWDGTDWFRTRETLYAYVSKRARRWLEDTVGNWVSFSEALLRQ